MTKFSLSVMLTLWTATATAQTPEPIPLLYDFQVQATQPPVQRLAVDPQHPDTMLALGTDNKVYAVDRLIGAILLKEKADAPMPAPPSPTVSKVETGVVMGARFTDPVTQQGQVTGWKSLEVRRRNGGVVKYTIPGDDLFVDRKPFIADLGKDGLQDVLAVRQTLDGESRLVVFAPMPHALVPFAETPPTLAGGRLDPVAVADFDGDGTTEVAMTNNTGGDSYLETWRLEQGKLVQQKRLYGYNSQIPSRGLEGVGVVVDLNGDGVADLLLPRGDLMGVAVVTFKDGYNQQLLRQDLGTTVASGLTVTRNAQGQPLKIGWLLANGQMALVERKATAD